MIEKPPLKMAQGQIIVMNDQKKDGNFGYIESFLSFALHYD